MGDRSKKKPRVSDPEVLEDNADLAEDPLPDDAEDVIVEEVDESAFAIPEPAVEPQEQALVPHDPLQRYLAEVRRYPFLTKEEELHLFNDFQATGNRESAVKLILSNLRVSVAIA